MKNQHFLLFMLAGSLSPVAQARPVTYLDGLAVTSENRPAQNEGSVAYTLTRRAAVGLWAARYRESKRSTSAFAPMASLLLTRWNGDFFQANAYASLGYGGLANGSHLVALLGEADAESRDLYASVRYEGVRSSRDFGFMRLRLGMAPFRGQMTDLNVWSVLEWDYDRWRHTVDITPLLRFFYQNVVWEAGTNLRGQTQINWTFER